MLFSNSTNYALRAVLYLAMESSEARKIGIREMAEQMNMPYHFLGKILQTLARNHLVQSSKGPNGGFYLTKFDKSTKVIKVVELFEGPDFYNQCALGLRECSEEHPCPVHENFKDFRDDLLHQLRTQGIDVWAQQVGEGKTALKC